MRSFGSGTSDRNKTAGVLIAPPAKIVRVARTVIFCPVDASDVRRESLGFHALHDVTFAQNANDPRAMNELGLVVQRPGNRRDKHRLLGVDRATKPAVTEVQTTAHVAVNRGP